MPSSASAISEFARGGDAVHQYIAPVADIREAIVAELTEVIPSETAHRAVCQRDAGELPTGCE